MEEIISISDQYYLPKPFTLQADPCSRIFCKKGYMCVPTADRKSAECYCPRECSQTNSPCCSVYFEEYSNICEMHQQTCGLNLNIALRNMGKCSGKRFSKFHLFALDFLFFIMLWVWLTKFKCQNIRCLFNKLYYVTITYQYDGKSSTCRHYKSYMTPSGSQGHYILLACIMLCHPYTSFSTLSPDATTWHEPVSKTYGFQGCN